MRVKRMAIIGIAAGAVMLSGGLAVATTGGTEDAATTLVSLANTSGSEDAAATDDTTADEPGTDAGEDPGPGARGHRPMLTDEQRACLEEEGLTPPRDREWPAERPTLEQMQAKREAAAAAFEACDIERPDRGFGHRGKAHAFKRGFQQGFKHGWSLTDEQKACLEEEGLTPPEDRERPTERPTREQMQAKREAVQAAFDACGIERPDRGPRGGAEPVAGAQI